MHWHQLHKFPKCFKSLHTLLWFSLCTSCHPFNRCRCVNSFNFWPVFWPVREFLAEIHTAKMVLWGVVSTFNELKPIVFVSACLTSSEKSMKTLKTPYPRTNNPIVVHLMCCSSFSNIVTALLSSSFLDLLTMCIRALFLKSATTLGLVEQAFWRMPFYFCREKNVNEDEILTTDEKIAPARKPCRHTTPLTQMELLQSPLQLTVRRGTWRTSLLHCTPTWHSKVWTKQLRPFSAKWKALSPPVPWSMRTRTLLSHWVTIPTSRSPSIAELLFFTPTWCQWPTELRATQCGRPQWPPFFDLQPVELSSVPGRKH